MRAPTHGGLEGPIAEAVKAERPGDWFAVRATICQPAWCCFCPCGSCRKLEFNIYKADDVNRVTVVGQFMRVWPGCLKAAVSV